MSAGRLTVEVAYALPQESMAVRVEVEPGATLRLAIERSGILARYPEIDLHSMLVGSYGRLRGLDEPVNPGERIEIYRPLIADPKEIRRQRASAARRNK